MRLIRSKYIFENSQLYENYAVLMHENNVMDTGNFNTLKNTYKEYKIEDKGEGVLFSGFVNAHTHLELSHLKNSIPETRNFIEWLKQIMMLKIENFPKEFIENSIINAINELKQSGVCAVGDISNTLISIKHLKKSLPSSVVFYENYSLNKNKACKTYKNLRENIRKIRTEAKPIKVSITPHAIYSTHRCLLSLLPKFNKNLPYSIHFLENSYENDFAKSKGKLFDFLNTLKLVDESLNFKSALNYLEQSNGICNNMLFVHMVYATKNDINRIKKCNPTIVICLRSNNYIGNKLPNLYMLNDSKINVAIGTDSLASNINLNFIDELKFIYKNFNNLDPGTIFTWATNGGAKALNLKLGFKKGYTAYPFFIKSCQNNPLDNILSEGLLNSQ